MFFKGQGPEKSFLRSRDAWILIALCLFCKCYSLVSPGTLQLDLVFPQQDAVYDAMEVLPIAMILHNVNFAWPAVPRLSWTLLKLIGNELGQGEGSEGSKLVDEGSYPENRQSYDEDVNKRGYWDETGPNNVLVVNPTRAIHRKDNNEKRKRSLWTLKRKDRETESDKYRLDIRLELDGDRIPICNDVLEQQKSSLPPGPQQILSNSQTSHINDNKDTAIRSSITFSVKSSYGSKSKTKPTLARSSPVVIAPQLNDCPSPIGAMRLAKDIKEPGCLALESSLPIFQHCVVKIDDYVRNKIVQAMDSAGAHSSPTASKVKSIQTGSSNLVAEQKQQTFQSGAAFMVALTGTFFGMVGLSLSMWTIYAGPEILLEIA